MAYDMFRCPKCKNVVFDYDWTMVSEYEDGFVCTQCDIIYSGEELNKLIKEFDDEPRTDGSWAAFDN